MKDDGNFTGSFRDLVGAVAACLNAHEAEGARWETRQEDEDSWNRESRMNLVRQGEGGAWIYLTLGGYRNEGRIRISGKYPHRGGTHYPSRSKGQEPITVSAMRSAEQIAADIRRRFLPGYLASLARANRELSDDAARDGRIGALTRELAAILRTEPNRGMPDEEPYRVHHYRDEGGYADVRVNSPDSVEIDIRSVPPEIARKILGALMGE
jgi:hypothetical protein